jgi:hypothetical protein
MSAAEEFAVFVEVDEVDEQLLADGANKAGRMPDTILSGTRSRHADVAAVNVTGTL